MRSWRPRSRPNWCRPSEGETPQSTEAQIGPYALQDFNLFYTLRYGFPPSKIAFLALHAWEDAAKGDWPPGFPPERRSAYDLATIRHWLEVFLRRFFAFSQFKRIGHAERAEGERGRLAVAARRLARAVRRQRQRLACRARTQRAEGVQRPTVP